MTPEGRVVAAIKKKVKEAGGECRKCSWEGRVGSPDLLVLLPGRHFWVEVKAPGEKPRISQAREIAKLQKAGCIVYVLDSVEAISRIIDKG